MLILESPRNALTDGPGSLGGPLEDLTVADPMHLRRCEVPGRGSYVRKVRNHRQTVEGLGAPMLHGGGIPVAN